MKAFQGVCCFHTFPNRLSLPTGVLAKRTTTATVLYYSSNIVHSNGCSHSSPCSMIVAAPAAVTEHATNSSAVRASLFAFCRSHPTVCFCTLLWPLLYGSGHGTAASATTMRGGPIAVASARTIAWHFSLPVVSRQGLRFNSPYPSSTLSPLLGLDAGISFCPQVCPLLHFPILICNAPRSLTPPVFAYKLFCWPTVCLACLYPTSSVLTSYRWYASPI